MGILHAGIINSLPDCQIVAICESDVLARNVSRKLLRNAHFYAKTEKMLAEEDLDAVFVTTPISSHKQVIQTIADNGSPHAIFVEKPLATTYKEAQESTAIAESSGVDTGVGFQKRFAPTFAKAKLLLEQGAIGTPTSFTAYSYLAGVFSQGKGWRFDPIQGGALVDLGPHLIDLIYWYLGEISVSGSCLSKIHSKTVENETCGTIV